MSTKKEAYLALLDEVRFVSGALRTELETMSADNEVEPQMQTLLQLLVATDTQLNRVLEKI